MGAIASLDILGIGTSIELAAQDGSRVTATGVAGGGGSGSAKVTADFVQPAVGATVNVSVDNTKGFALNGYAEVDTGGHYVVTGFPAPGVFTLSNPGGAPNVSPGTTILAGSAVSGQAPSVNAQFSASPYSVLPEINVRDPLFGAVGDDVADDIAAFEAAAAAAAASGFDLVIPPPAVKYRLSRTWVPPRGITIRGSATALGQCTLRCSTDGMAVVSLHSTDNTTLGTQPITLERLTLEANGAKALNYGLLRNGDWFSRVRQVFCRNALDGDHANGHRLPAIIGPVTPGGGAPAGLTVTQPDPGYCGVATGTLAIKVTGGATAYVMSTDGGVTYATATQPIVPGGPSNVMVAALAAFVASSGFQVHFPAGPFADGQFWTFAITIQPEDAGEQHTIDVETLNEDITCDTCGAVPVEAGTVAVTIGSIVVQGTGTTWLTDPAKPPMRPGDSITIHLADIAGPGSTQATFPVMGVGDDTTLYLYPQEGVLVQTSGSGAAYKRAIGYGIYEDDSGDMVRNQRRGGRVANCANGWRATGDQSGGQYSVGPRIEPGIDNNTGIGILFGGVLQGSQDHVAIVPELKSGRGCTLYFAFGTTVTLFGPRQSINPKDPTSCYGSFAAAMLLAGTWLRYAPFQSGSAVSGASSLPVLASQWVTNFVDVNPGDTLVAPDLLSPSPLNTTNTIVVPSADCAGPAASPLFLPKPPAIGLFWWIQVDPHSNFVVQLNDASFAGPHAFLQGPAEVLAGGERVLLVSIQTNDPFTAQWTQFGPVHRQFTGPFGKGSHSGEGSGYCITTPTGLTQVLGLWDLTFAGGGGFQVSCEVQARDTGNTDQAFFHDVQIAVDNSPGLLGGISIAVARGTNAGAPPAGYSLAYAIVNVAGDLQLQLQATGPAGRTVKWFQRNKVDAVIHQ